MLSIWEQTVKREEKEQLTGNKSTDVLIIGGGIAGILCAYMLKSKGVDCIVAEADRICSGVTKNTTAKITLAHSLCYDKMIKRFGEEKAKMYLDAQVKAGECFSRLCRDIDCDYEIKDSYVYSLNDRKKIEDEIKALNKLGVKAEFSMAQNLPFEITGAVKVKNQAQFHPLKFAYKISEELPIFEKTKVINMKPYKAVTHQGEISFKKLIVATHFPIYNKHGGYSLKLYQHRSYVTALRNASDVNGMYVDEADKGMSFRNYKDLLFVGGGDHRTGKKGGCWKELEEFKDKYYKDAHTVAKWAAQDCMTLDGVSYIGQYSEALPDVYAVTGFNKWGMTLAMAGAEIISDMIIGKGNPCASVFSPSRSVFRPQLAVNIFEAVMGIITPTVPRCPHLGCALKYNEAEHSWDCSCHGSRFSENGKLLDNPATDDKKDM